MQWILYLVTMDHLCYAEFSLGPGAQVQYINHHRSGGVHLHCIRWLSEPASHVFVVVHVLYITLHVHVLLLMAIAIHVHTVNFLYCI